MHKHLPTVRGIPAEPHSPGHYVFIEHKAQMLQLFITLVAHCKYLTNIE